jgi:tRNA(Ser,Leu) C12 N-acetylase TAN1
MEANLLVTYDPVHPGKAQREAAALLDDFGNFDFVDTKNDGIFLMHVDSPKKIVKELSLLPKDSFEMTFKWVPIEKWVQSNVDEITKVMLQFNSQIDKGKSWKLALFKRKYKGHDTLKLIEILTESIDNEKVSLTDPDMIIVIEIIGELAGCSLLKKSEYLDTQKL